MEDGRSLEKRLNKQFSYEEKIISVCGVIYGMIRNTRKSVVGSSPGTKEARVSIRCG